MKKWESLSLSHSLSRTHKHTAAFSFYSMKGAGTLRRKEERESTARAENQKKKGKFRLHQIKKTPGVQARGMNCWTQILGLARKREEAPTQKNERVKSREHPLTLRLPLFPLAVGAFANESQFMLRF